MNDRNEFKSCKLRLKCLEEIASVRLNTLSPEIDCRVNTYLSCNFNPFKYRNSSNESNLIINESTSKQNRPISRMPSNLNKFMDNFVFRWYDQHGMLIRNFNRPTHFMIRQELDNLSSIMISNKYETRQTS